MAGAKGNWYRVNVLAGLVIVPDAVQGGKLLRSRGAVDGFLMFSKSR